LFFARYLATLRLVEGSLRCEPRTVEIRRTPIGSRWPENRITALNAANAKKPAP
jgi:hypothetical protein